MNSQAEIEQLNNAVDELIAGAESARVDSDAETRDLLDVARELRYLPRPEFKAQ